MIMVMMQEVYKLVNGLLVKEHTVLMVQEELMVLPEVVFPATLFPMMEK